MICEGIGFVKLFFFFFVIYLNIRPPRNQGIEQTYYTLFSYVHFYELYSAKKAILASCLSFRNKIIGEWSFQLISVSSLFFINIQVRLVFNFTSTQGYTSALLKHFLFIHSFQASIYAFDRVIV